MKAIFKKVLALFAVSALVAGTIFLPAFARRVPSGVRVLGTEVGGMTFSQAAHTVRGEIVRDLKGRELTVLSECNSYSFSYPEIGFTDNLQQVLAGAVKGGEYTLNIRCHLNGLESIVSGICAAEYVEVREPEVLFNADEGEPFEYRAGRVGIVADEKKLAENIRRALADRRYGGEFDAVHLPLKKILPETSAEELKERTARLSAYTTYFDGENLPRSHNIRLAGREISGSIVAAGEEFSFNDCVGERTEERGFQRAKVILNGEYTYGTGGGVCQMSTTLYNAALLAGFSVTEYHPHSLAVGYVSPSRDAMVSGTKCDLKFVNTTKCTAYIRVLTGKNYVRCEIYGYDDGSEYSLSSKVCSWGEDGMRSEAYITVTRGGKRTTKLLRRDRYLPAPPASQEEPSEVQSDGQEEPSEVQEEPPAA